METKRTVRKKSNHKLPTESRVVVISIMFCMGGIFMLLEKLIDKI